MSYDFPAHESTRKRRRWGCTCGCVLILILLIIVGSIFFYFGLKPHKDFPRYAMIDGETDGFGVLRMNPEDEGMQQFTTFLLRRLEKSYAAEDPAQAKVVNAVRKVSKNLFTQLVQPETMLYFTYNPVTADENIVITVPLKNRFALVPIRQYIRDNIAPEPVSTEGMAEIYPLHAEDSGTSRLLSLDPDDIVYSDNEPLLLKSLGYARDQARVATPSATLQQFIDELALDQPPDGEDLALAFVNEESRIINMIHLFEEFVDISGIANQVGSALSAQKLTFEDISGLKLTADLASADLLKGELTLYCPNAETATRLAKVFETSLPNITGEQADGIFQLEGTSRSRGATVVVALELSGLEKWVLQLLPVVETPAAPAPGDAVDPVAETEAATTVEVSD